MRCGCVYFFNLLKTSTVSPFVWEYRTNRAAHACLSGSVSESLPTKGHGICRCLGWHLFINIIVVQIVFVNNCYFDSLELHLLSVTSYKKNSNLKSTRKQCSPWSKGFWRINLHLLLIIIIFKYLELHGWKWMCLFQSTQMVPPMIVGLSYCHKSYMIWIITLLLNTA